MSDNHWYTENYQRPVHVELLAHGKRENYWRVEGPNGEFEAHSDSLFTDEYEAWQVYLRWAKGVVRYLVTFGIDADFFVMKDLFARQSHARARLLEMKEENEEKSYE